MKRFALYAFLSFISTLVHASAPAPDEAKKQIRPSLERISDLIAISRALLGDEYPKNDSYLSDGETEDDKTLPVHAPDLHRAAFSCKRSSLEIIKTLLAGGSDPQAVCIRTDIEVMCEVCLAYAHGLMNSPKPHCNHPPMEQTALDIAQNRLEYYNYRLSLKGFTHEQYDSMPVLYTGLAGYGVQGVDLKKVIPLFKQKILLLEDAMKKQQKAEEK